MSYALNSAYNRKRYLKYANGGNFWETDEEKQELLSRSPIRFTNQLMPNRAPSIEPLSLKRLPGDTAGSAVQNSADKAAKGSAITGAVGTIAPLAAGVLDAIDGGNEYGRQKRGTTIAKGALNGAATGAALGPWGAAAGAVIGGVTGIISSGKEKKAEEKMLYEKMLRDKKMEAEFSAAQIAANPSLYQGYRNAEYFENGGSMRKKRRVEDYAPTELMEQVRANGYALGGSINPMSSDGTEVNGNTHAQGGVRIPGMGVELEDNETTKGDYVFSSKLGFAQVHKPIMKAKGKIEAKPYTRDRANSIQLLNQREERLKGAQEYFKKTRGIIN